MSVTITDEAEIKRRRSMSVKELLESGEWIKLYDLPRPSHIWWDYDFSDEITSINSKELRTDSK